MGNPIARTNSLGMSILVASYLHSYPYSLESYLILVLFYTTARNDPQIIGPGRRVAGSKKKRCDRGSGKSG